MLTQEEDIDAHALRKRGWTISAIARHLGRDRKTVRYADIGLTHRESTASPARPAG
jgi:transcriptional regulator